MFWIGRLNMIKISILPNLIYRFIVISIKIPASYKLFYGYHKLMLKFIWRGRRLRIASTILKGEGKVRVLALPDFTTYYKAIEINRMRYLKKNRQINGME